MSDSPSDIRQRVLAFIADSAADAFDDIALSVFRFQFEHNPAYRAFCERRSRTPGSVTGWDDIPAVPAAAFKHVALVAGDAAHARAVFRTSGTTRGTERRGVHYVLDTDIYEASLLSSFSACVLPDDARMPMLSLIASSAAAPESSLSYMVTTVLRDLGTDGSSTFADVEGIDFHALDEAVHRFQRAGRSICLLGTSLAFVHWLDHLAATGARFALPPGSRLMDTGGFKGSTREIGEDDLRALYVDRFGIEPHAIVNEYGMTEMLSQFYDSGLRDEVQGRSLTRRKIGPHWVRSRIVHPETLEPLPRGRTGILRHLDLANLFSVSAIQTEDQAIEVDDGFVLLGRAPGAAPRGCSIAMDLLLDAVGRTR